MLDSFFMREHALFLIAIVLLARCEAADHRANILLVTMDTVRADRMGFMGSRAGLTPHLNALAREAMVFTEAYAQAPITTASHASLLTGTYPQFHRVNDFGKPLPAGIPSLAVLLQQHGYATGAFVGSVILDANNGLAPGFDRGFDVYDAGYKMRRSGKESRYGTVERRAGDVVTRALHWLQKSRKQPFFLWVHLYDAHDPYEAPGEYRSANHSAYDSEVAYVDASIGRLLRGLRERDRFQNTMIVATSDHGEALGEHGERTHGVFLYNETMHVPLVLQLPTNRGGRKISRRVELVDVAPTVLEVAQIKAPGSMQGRSLLAVASAAEENTAYAETDYPRRAFGWSSLAALRHDKYLYVKAPARELYNLEIDPKATRNIASASPAVADMLAARLEAFRRRTSSGEGSVEPGLTAEQAQQLAALGYVGGATTVAQEIGTQIDPKAKVEIANTLHAAIMAVEDARYSEARPLLEKVVKEDPQIYTAQMQLGVAYAKEQKFVEAISHLKAAIVIQPDSAMAQYELGLALFEKGDVAGSAPYFEAAVERTPRWADAHFALGSVYARTERIRDALDHLQTALELKPDHFRANLLTGRILALQGRPDVGVPLLEKAVKLQDTSAEAHRFLADAYRKVGRVKDAEAHEARARSLRPQ